jgi:hypothetical protein
MGEYRMREEIGDPVPGGFDDIWELNRERLTSQKVAFVWFIRVKTVKK